nr:putative geranylgeranyl pyrophosphate synthetase (GGPP synthetase) (GGPS) [Includes: Dimethylallyltranstransferase; Geranyltranstransferase; Farnesyltranstransferase ] [uncultured archaeon]
MAADIDGVVAQYQAKINERLGWFFDEKIEEASKISDYTQEVVVNIKEYTLRGGKRLRPIFLIYGYKCITEDNIDAIIEASISIELMQSYLLIHDDIMDEDELRRGKPTFHIEYENICATLFGDDDTRKFGENIAILAGDLLEAYGIDVLTNSRFKEEYITRALQKYAEIVKNVGYGQILDIMSEKKKDITEAEILRIHKLKTASYTIENPLQIGAILAGAVEADLAVMSNYGLPLGLAFQIQDDILGLFGTEEKIGKPVGSDIQEGKKTLLILHALSNCSEKEKGIITSALGNADVTMAEIDTIREIVRETGSLDYSKRLVGEKIEEAIHAIERSNFRAEAKEFLVKIADFVGVRDF